MTRRRASASASAGRWAFSATRLRTSCERGAGRRRGDGQPIGQLDPLGPIRVAHDRVEEGLLALDVEVDGALGDSHASRHVGHLGAAVALLEEDRGGGLDQVVETVLRNRARHAGQNT